MLLDLFSDLFLIYCFNFLLNLVEILQTFFVLIFKKNFPVILTPVGLWYLSWFPRYCHPDFFVTERTVHELLFPVVGFYEIVIQTVWCKYREKVTYFLPGNGNWSCTCRQGPRLSEQPQSRSFQWKCRIQWSWTLTQSLSQFRGWKY